MATIKQRIDNVTENVTDGKQDIASAITDKGVSTSSNATFSTMADNIRAIETPPRDRIVNSANTIYVIAGEKGVIIGDNGDNYNVASGNFSVAMGSNANAIGNYSIAEGNNAYARGQASHTEGESNTSIGDYSHAEGYNTSANGISSHTEGDSTIASGNCSHAEGNQTEANGANSHAEGLGCIAIGVNSHAEGYYTQTYNTGEHACGKWNKSTSGTTSSTGATLFSVGLGSYNGDRNNAIEITQTGILKCKTTWQVGSDRKLKDNITPLEDGTLDKVLQLNPVRFTLKDDIDKKNKIGFIAQEVEDVFPEYVTISVDNEGEETRYLDYSQMVSILCKAIQELKQEVEELKSK